MDQFSEEAVFARLEEYHADVVGVVRAAFKRWIEIAPAFAGPSLRTRRNNMYEFMAEEARTRFTGRDGVKPRDTKHEQVLLDFPARGGVGALLMRFKHLDEQLATRNFPTSAAIAYDGPSALPGMPQMRLTAGYQLNDAESEITGIHIVRAVKVLDRGRLRTNVLWSYELAKPGSDRIAELPLQRTFGEEMQRQAGARVRPRNAPAKKPKTGSDAE